MGRLRNRVFEIKKGEEGYQARFWINEDCGAALVALLDLMGSDGVDPTEYRFHLFPWFTENLVQTTGIVAVKRKNG